MSGYKVRRCVPAKHRIPVCACVSYIHRGPALSRSHVSLIAAGQILESE